MDEIEKLLLEDKRKYQGFKSGVRGRASRTGRIGKMITPFDLMSPSEKKKLLESEVKVYSMFDNIIPFEEFQKLPKEKQREVLQNWREKYNNTKIIEAWNIPKTKYYKIVKELDLPLNRGSQLEQTSSIPELKETLNKFHIMLEGEYQGSYLADKILKLTEIMEADKLYNIKLQIQEI